MKSKNKLTAVVLMLCLMCTFFTAGSLASNTVKAADEKPVKAENGIVGIANRGMWHSEPENSLEALTEAAMHGIDGVLADVSLTKDGVPVLMEALSARRMLSEGDREAVCEYSLEELQEMFLREGSGGKNNKVSTRKIVTLEKAAKELEKTECLLVLKTDVSCFEAVEKAAEGKKNTAFYLTGNAKQIKQLLATKGGSVNIITEKKGNVVFAQTSFVDFAAKNGAVGVVLKTKNRYGVNFNRSVLSRLTKACPGIADLSQPETAGARQDTEKWWDDLISRGYSVIITNDVQGFVDYKNENEQSRIRLEAALKKYTEEWTLPRFKSFIFNDYNKAYNDAVTKAAELINDTSSSGQDMDDCYAALVKACDDIDLNYEELEQGKAGMTVSPIRILLCIAFAVAVVAVQLFFFKRRKKA